MRLAGWLGWSEPGGGISVEGEKVAECYKSLLQLQSPRKYGPAAASSFCHRTCLPSMRWTLSWGKLAKSLVQCHLCTLAQSYTCCPQPAPIVLACATATIATSLVLQGIRVRTTCPPEIGRNSQKLLAAWAQAANPEEDA